MVMQAKRSVLIPPSSIYITLTEISENKCCATVTLTLKLFLYNWNTWEFLKALSELFIKESSSHKCSYDLSECHPCFLPDKLHHRLWISFPHNKQVLNKWSPFDLGNVSNQTTEKEPNSGLHLHLGERRIYQKYMP